MLVNLARDAEEGLEVFRRLSLATEKFLNLSLKSLGCIPFDESVRKAVKAQKAFVDMYPDSSASKKIAEIAPKLLNHDGKVKGTLQFFIKDLLLGAVNS